MSRRVRFTSRVGLVTATQPDRFAEPVAEVGDVGEVIAAPFTVPDGWLVVRVDTKWVDPWDETHAALYAPVTERMIEDVGPKSWD